MGMGEDQLDTMNVRNEPYHQLMAYRLKSMHDKYLMDKQLFREAVLILFAQLWGELDDDAEFAKLDEYRRMTDQELWFRLGKLCKRGGYCHDQAYGATSSFGSISSKWRGSK